MRSLAWMAALAARLPRPLAASLISSFLGRAARRSFGLDEVSFDRDAIARWIESYESVSLLPTIAAGLRDVGLSSPAEWFWSQRRVCRGPSRYAHPLLRPYFYYPGVSVRRFYDSDQFGWAHEARAALPKIREEVLGVWGRGACGGFQPMMSYEERRYQHQQGARIASEDPMEAAWKSFFFIKPGGQPVAENIARCPGTWEVLQRVPRLVRGHTVMFSAMHPRTTLPPHVGLFNHVLRVLLGVLVPEPEHAFIRVGDESRNFREGESLILNDGFRHSAVNRGNETRIVLFFDIWHPDLRSDEIAVLERHDTLLMEAMGGAIRAYEERCEQDADRSLTSIDSLPSLANP